ncbi:MAG: hypothetical protein ACRC5H_06870 [Treponemataceae bacterium]
MISQGFSKEFTVIFFQKNYKDKTIVNLEESVKNLSKLLKILQKRKKGNNKIYKRDVKKKLLEKKAIEICEELNIEFFHGNTENMRQINKIKSFI